jgi:hypothetical protein
VAAMRTPELQARHRASAVVCHMLLILSHSMLQGYSRNRNIAAVFPEMLVVAAIRVNDDQGRPPISINRIAKVVGLPRQNVRRAIAQLIKHGLVQKSGNGYIFCDSYVEARLRARYFRRMVAAIRAAAHELRNFK